MSPAAIYLHFPETHSAQHYTPLSTENQLFIGETHKQLPSLKKPVLAVTMVTIQSDKVTESLFAKQLKKGEDSRLTSKRMTTWAISQDDNE